MLLWLMNLGFAANPSSTVVVTVRGGSMLAARIVRRRMRGRRIKR